MENQTLTEQLRVGRIGPYMMQEAIGSGTFGKVRRAVHEVTGDQVAIKIINKDKIRGDMSNNLSRELRHLRKLNHPHIIRLHDVYDGPKQLYIVLEYVSGGELFDYIDKTRLCEAEARLYFQQLIAAVDHCHSNGITHRDLKPENILIEEADGCGADVCCFVGRHNTFDKAGRNSISNVASKSTARTAAAGHQQIGDNAISAISGDLSGRADNGVPNQINVKNGGYSDVHGDPNKYLLQPPGNAIPTTPKQENHESPEANVGETEAPIGKDTAPDVPTQPLLAAEASVTATVPAATEDSKTLVSKLTYDIRNNFKDITANITKNNLKDITANIARNNLKDITAKYTDVTNNITGIKAKYTDVASNITDAAKANIKDITDVANLKANIKDITTNITTQVADSVQRNAIPVLGNGLVATQVQQVASQVSSRVKIGNILGSKVVDKHGTAESLKKMETVAEAEANSRVPIENNPASHGMTVEHCTVDSFCQVSVLSSSTETNDMSGGTVNKSTGSSTTKSPCIAKNSSGVSNINTQIVPDQNSVHNVEGEQGASSSDKTDGFPTIPPAETAGISREYQDRSPINTDLSTTGSIEPQYVPTPGTIITACHDDISPYETVNSPNAKDDICSKTLKGLLEPRCLSHRFNHETDARWGEFKRKGRFARYKSVKICDFGLSNSMRDGEFFRTSCGSPNYASPEIVSGKAYAGPEVDVWSCGVVLYALLCSQLPFDDPDMSSLFRKIRHGNFSLAGHLSSEAKDLIVQLLIVDPTKRITIGQIQKHPWFRKDMPRYLQPTNYFDVWEDHEENAMVLKHVRRSGETPHKDREADFKGQVKNSNATTHVSNGKSDNSHQEANPNANNNGECLNVALNANSEKDSNREVNSNAQVNANVFNGEGTSNEKTTKNSREGRRSVSNTSEHRTDNRNRKFAQIPPEPWPEQGYDDSEVTPDRIILLESSAEVREIRDKYYVKGGRVPSILAAPEPRISSRRSSGGAYASASSNVQSSVTSSAKHAGASGYASGNATNVISSSSATSSCSSSAANSASSSDCAAVASRKDSLKEPDGIPCPNTQSPTPNVDDSHSHRQQAGNGKETGLPPFQENEIKTSRPDEIPPFKSKEAPAVDRGQRQPGRTDRCASPSSNSGAKRQSSQPLHGNRPKMMWGISKWRLGLEVIDILDPRAIFQEVFATLLAANYEWYLDGQWTVVCRPMRSTDGTTNANLMPRIVSTDGDSTRVEHDEFGPASKNDSGRNHKGDGGTGIGQDVGDIDRGMVNIVSDSEATWESAKPKGLVVTIAMLRTGDRKYLIDFTFTGALLTGSFCVMKLFESIGERVGKLPTTKAAIVPHSSSRNSMPYPSSSRTRLRSHHIYNDRKTSKGTGNDHRDVSRHHRDLPSNFDPHPSKSSALYHRRTHHAHPSASQHGLAAPHHAPHSRRIPLDDPRVHRPPVYHNTGHPSAGHPSSSSSAARYSNRHAHAQRVPQDGRENSEPIPIGAIPGTRNQNGPIILPMRSREDDSRPHQDTSRLRQDGCRQESYKNPCFPHRDRNGTNDLSKPVVDYVNENAKKLISNFVPDKVTTGVMDIYNRFRTENGESPMKESMGVDGRSDVPRKNEGAKPAIDRDAISDLRREFERKMERKKQRSHTKPEEKHEVYSKETHAYMASHVKAREAHEGASHHNGSHPAAPHPGQNHLQQNDFASERRVYGDDTDLTYGWQHGFMPEGCHPGAAPAYPQSSSRSGTHHQNGNIHSRNAHQQSGNPSVNRKHHLTRHMNSHNDREHHIQQPHSSAGVSNGRPIQQIPPIPQHVLTHPQTSR